jgi:hypothetical protein
MKINLNLSKEDQANTREILKAMASKNKSESWEAQEIFAAFVGPTIDQVLEQTATSNLVYQNFSYDSGSNPSIPLDLLEDNTEGLITVWSETLQGGLATNHVSGMDDFRFTVDNLTSAVSCLTQYAREARMDVMRIMIQRMVQEILAKSEYLNWATLLASVANSRANSTGDAQVYSGATAGTFKLADLNTVWTKVKRLRTSWLGGTPTSVPGRGLTHLLISPEVEGDIRAMVYNPQNTEAVPDTNESTAVPAPESMREEIYRNAGLSSLWGVTLIPLLELGVGQVYNQLFDDYYTPVGGEPTFNPATQEVLIGLDLSVPAYLKLTETDADVGSQTVVEPDDQWVRRSEKLGFFAKRREGRIATDSKAGVALII